MKTSESVSMAPFVFNDGRVHARIDARVYRLTAIQKAAYRLAKQCTVVLGVRDADAVPITIIFDGATTEHGALEVTRRFFEELLDQELREQLGHETRDLRALILAHAFSKTDLIRAK